jgi:hypothetical protein
MMAKVRSHSPVLGLRPVLAVIASPKVPPSRGRAVLHGDGIRLLGPRALDGPPLEEAVDRHDAAPACKSLPERGES